MDSFRSVDRTDKINMTSELLQLDSNQQPAGSLRVRQSGASGGSRGSIPGESRPSEGTEGARGLPNLVSFWSVVRAALARQVCGKDGMWRGVRYTRDHPVEWLCRRIMRALIIAALTVGVVFTLAYLGDEQQQPHEWRYVVSTDHPAFAVFVVCTSLLIAWGAIAVTRRATRRAER